MSLQPKTLLQKTLAAILEKNAQIFLYGFTLYISSSVKAVEVQKLKVLLDELCEMRLNL